MSATSLDNSALPPAHSADGCAANSDTVPAPVGIRPAWLRFWPAALGGAAVLAAMIGVILATSAPERQAVQDGKRFSAAERRTAVVALRAAGIEAATAGDGQLFVRPPDLTAANAALKQAEASAAADVKSPAASWLDAFATSRQQQAAAESSNAARLGRLLEELPGVESAEVVWDEEPRIGRRQAPRVRATVFLKPETECAIELDTVQAVRAAVSGSRAHLAAQDVAVMDLERRVTYGTQSDPVVFAAEVRRAELIATCRSRISTALADVEGVRIALDLEGPAVIDAPSHFDSTSAAAEPVPRPTRPRIAGLSGPNLRLEVSSEPPQQTAAADPAVRSFAAAQASLPQLDVSIILPGEASSSPRIDGDAPQARPPEHAARTADLRRRIASAVAGLPVTLPPSRLHMTVLSPVTGSMHSVRPETEEQRFAGASAIVARLAAMPLLQHTSAGVLVMTLLIVAVRRIRRRRRRSSVSPTAVGRHTAPGRSPSRLEFLPGVKTATWAPLVAREPAPVVAGLLQHLSADDVSQLLAELAPALQSEVLELAPTAHLSAAQLDDVRRRIRSGLATVELTATPRPRATPPAIRRRAAPNSATAVFDDLVTLDDESLRELASRVHDVTWSAALIGAAPRLQRRMSKLRISTGGSPDAQERRPMRLREIESAQRTVLDAWQTLQVGG